VMPPARVRRVDRASRAADIRPWSESMKSATMPTMPTRMPQPPQKAAYSVWEGGEEVGSWPLMRETERPRTMIEKRIFERISVGLGNVIGIEIDGFRGGEK